MVVSFAACTSLEKQSHYNVQSSNWEGYLFNEKSFLTKMPKLHNHIMPFCTWQSLRLFMSIKAWFNVLRCFPAKQKLNRHLLGTRIFHLANEKILQSPLGTWIKKLILEPEMVAMHCSRKDLWEYFFFACGWPRRTWQGIYFYPNYSYLNEYI